MSTTPSEVSAYRTIVADPPWAYRQAEVTGRNAVRKDGTAALGISSVNRYGSMTTEELCALRPPAADDAHLYLWFTNAFAAEAHEIARAWGFKPKTILTWTKVKADGSPSMKMGYYFRGATEHVLFAVRGRLRLHAERALPTAYLWPRAPHSVKPDTFYDLVEEASPGPYLELFARRRRPGWHHWGNEVESDVTLLGDA